jgi:cobalt-zinc-cadmium efflux system membrane fusion protein
MHRYRILAIGSPVLILVALAWWFLPYRAREHELAAVESFPSGGAVPGGDLVTLSQEQQAAAGIQLARVVPRPLRHIKTVTGRITYDETRRVELRLPLSGIVTRVLVQVGDMVQVGDVLAIASSPEVAAARSEMMLRRDEFDAAERARALQQEIHDGVARMLKALSKHIRPAELQSLTQELRLGEYRQELVSAYSRLELASRLALNAEAVGGSGAVPLRVLEERRSELLSAEAAFRGLVEQSEFDIVHELALAESAAKHARRRLKISQDYLQTLLGLGESPLPPATAEEGLSVVEIRAPIEGSVQALHIAAAQRIEPASPLLDLADTRRVWVAADIREGEWEALGLQTGQELRLKCPAEPDHELRGVVRFVAREVNPQSRAVPLVAVVENEHGHLRPGQFVRVLIPGTNTHEVLAVPDEAITRHEGKEFVFRRTDHSQFQPVRIQTGMHGEGWTEITNGLTQGDWVVIQGTFTCKSEWILSHELR